MKQVAPAILTDDPVKFKEMVESMEKFAPMIQVDVMDGKLVPSSSIGADVVAGLKTSAFCEAHLMVEEPKEWIEAFDKFGAKRILVHYEMKNKDFDTVFEDIRSRGMELGLVVNPDTEIEEFEGLLDKVDQVLFMSVYPGFYGAAFVPKVMDKIKAFKAKYPEMKISIDGGVNKNNIKELSDLGLDILCVGSAIGKADDPKAAWEELMATVNA